MAWRTARSLTTLSAEVRQRWPGTTIWTLGDQDHASRASDHNPNPAGVVCAADIVGRTQAKAVWNLILDERDERVKYVIHDELIVSSTNQPWVIRPYTGANDHKNHAHVSVGRGPDGQSVRGDLYDDPKGWWPEMALTPDEEEFVRWLKKEFEASANPAFDSSVDKAKAAGIYSEFTDDEQPVTNSKLAVFLDRAGLLDGTSVGGLTQTAADKRYVRKGSTVTIT